MIDGVDIINFSIGPKNETTNFYCDEVAFSEYKP